MLLPVYFAQKAFIIERERLLAVRRAASDPNQPYRWEVPGGRLEAGEELDAHLAREVFEETSLQVRPGAPFCIWKWEIRRVDELQPNTVVAVGRLCALEGGELGANNRVDDDHLDIARWIPLAKLSEYDWIPNMLPVLDALCASFALKAITWRDVTA